MPDEQPPRSITELWYRLDKRLAAIELAQAQHSISHGYLRETLSDHEHRLRSAASLSGLIAGSGGLLSVIALIRSFFGG